MKQEQAKTKIYVAGHQGMVGSAIVRILDKHYSNRQDLAKEQDRDVLRDHDANSRSALPEIEIVTRTHAELDLTDQAAVRIFFEKEKPDQVYLAAAKVGGIHANNTYPAEFIYKNLMIEANVVETAFQNGVKKLLFLGSSCIYPKLANQPMHEDSLLTGKLEPTNEPYAIAKIAGIKLCESYNRQYAASHGVDYRSVMPTNLYGPGDNYHLTNSHVIPALIRRFHEAKLNSDKNVVVWGSGKVKREFLYVDDMALACVHVMNLDRSTYNVNTEPMCSHVNVGTGVDLTINDLAERVKDVVGYLGTIEFDISKPDGSPRKLMDSQRLNNLGWHPNISLKDGLAKTYESYLKSL